MNRRMAVVPFEAELQEPSAAGVPKGARFVHPRDLDLVPSGSMLQKALAGVGAGIPGAKLPSPAAGEPAEPLD